MSDLEYRAADPGNLRELARLAFAWSSLVKAVGRREKEHRAALYEAMRKNGIEKQAILDDEDVRLGSVAWQEPRVVAKVTDLDALVDWVERHYPTEVHTVTITDVHAAFLRKLLESATERGVAVHAPTGEVIPGITVSNSEPFIRVTETRAAETFGDRILEAMAPPTTEGI